MKCEICGEDEKICPILRGEKLYGAPLKYNSITKNESTSEDKVLSLFSDKTK